MSPEVGSTLKLESSMFCLFTMPLLSSTYLTLSLALHCFVVDVPVI